MGNISEGQRREGKARALPTFADVFAGCGGISLGLVTAGWRGLFAIEKSPDAFKTLQTNLVKGRRKKFDWPDWLPQAAISTTTLLQDYEAHLSSMRGKVDLLAGGPPCQGFSFAGRRVHSDPRNSLTDDYIRIVTELEPRFLLIENVRGFTLPFKKHGDEESKTIPYSTRVIERLTAIGYKVYSRLMDLSQYGVPQTRKRFIIIAIRSNDPAIVKLQGQSPFDLLEKRRKHFLGTKGLPHDRPVSVSEAIGDLTIADKKLVDCADAPIKGFKQLASLDGNFTSTFIKLMQKGARRSPDSLRLPRHNAETVELFQKITKVCRRGMSIQDDDRRELGIKKHAITPLDPNLPSATITTLPDDIIHYSEPRILTVRENARIQTFPDWYRFTGNYTTGGKERKGSCPRYTQVGNAVPPLFSEAVGRLLFSLASLE